MKYHCFFEQSGTFKNEFKKLGYKAYDYDILKTRLRETAFFLIWLRITLNDDRKESPVSETFHYEGGIKEFVA